MYELSKNMLCHARDVRCLDFHAGYLVTGGSDKIFKMFSVGDAQIDQIATSDIFDSNILSIKISRKPQSLFVLVGSVDGKIHGFDQAGSPIALFQHSSQISSLDFINDDHFVSGSWDGKAIIWSISTKKQVREFTEHKYAVSVFYNPITDQIVSGSQDKALNCWNWKTGELIKRKEAAHQDIIRQISGVNEVGFLTCSNDETLKVWSSDLEEMQTLTGHTAFIFTAKSQQLGSYYSGSDDKSIRVWDGEKAIQTINCPSSIWSIALNPNGDIYAGCSDGFLRVFTTDPNRKAALKQIQAFNKEALDSASKKSGMSAEEISKLPTVQQMGQIPGKKQGQVRVFKNGIIPEAFMWQASKWEKIGEVITEHNQEGGVQESKYYPGDKYFEAGQYDYLFDVDDESGHVKTIPFNDGGNVLEAAEKYCLREGLSKGYIEQIRKFLMTNSSKIPRAALKQKSEKIISTNSLQCTPQCMSIEYTGVKNPAALSKKISEFNEKLEGSVKLNEKQLAYCERISTLLENSHNYHSWKLDFKEMDTIIKLLKWPKEYKFPVWDLLRAFLCHYQSQSLFSGLDAGFDILSQLAAGLERENSEAIYTLICKTLANTMIQNTNKNGILKHSEIVFDSIQNFSKNHSHMQSKNLLAAIAGLLFNFSVTVNEKVVDNSKVISWFAKLVERRLELDNSQQNQRLLLQTVANVVFKHQDCKDQFRYALEYCKGNHEVCNDLQILLS